MAEGIIPKNTEVSSTDYCLFPYGTLIQWGTFDVTIQPNSYTEYTILFSKPFGIEGCKIVAMPVIWSDPKYYSIIARSNGQGQVLLRVGTTAPTEQNIKVNWIAIGKL